MRRTHAVGFDFVRDDRAAAVQPMSRRSAQRSRRGHVVTAILIAMVAMLFYGHSVMGHGAGVSQGRSVVLPS